MSPSDTSGDGQRETSGSGDSEKRKSRTIDGTAEDVTDGAPRGITPMAVALPVLAFLLGAAILAAVLWQAGLLVTGGPAATGPVTQRLEAAETRVEALLRDVERLGGQLQDADAEREALRTQLGEAESALEAAGAQAPENLASSEELDAALRLLTEVESRLSEAEAALEAAGEAVDPARVEQLEANLAALDERVAAAEEQAATAAGLDQRVASMEAGITAIGGRQTTMEEQLGAVRTQVGAVGARTEANSQAIEAAGDRANALSARADELDARLQAVESRVDQPEAARRAALGIALASLSGAAAEGAPFEAELDAVARLAPDAANVEALEDAAETGVADANTLLERFRPAARAALKAETAEASEGLWDRLWANASSVVTVRRTGALEGDGSEARLARAEAALENGNVAAAVAEVEALTGAAAEAMAGWLEEAQARARVNELIAGLRRTLLTDLAVTHGTSPGANESEGGAGE